MSSLGLRARRKLANRELIAATAARLFAERGYENVAVIDVARAAEVSEQTVYNHFPTKEHLVLDRDEELRDRLVECIRARSSGTSPAGAIRPDALEQGRPEAVVDEFSRIAKASLHDDQNLIYPGIADQFTAAAVS